MRFDADAMLQVVDGDLELLGELARLFGEQGSAHLSGLHDAVAAGDTAEIRRLGHALKGSAATLYGKRAAELGHRMEEAGQKGDLVTARATLPELNDEVHALQEELAALARRLNGDKGRSRS